MSQNLNSLMGVLLGIIRGTTFRVIKGMLGFQTMSQIIPTRGLIISVNSLHAPRVSEVPENSPYEL